MESGDGQVTLSVNAPEDDGGSAITDYQYIGRNPWISIGSTDTPYDHWPRQRHGIRLQKVRAVNRARAFLPTGPKPRRKRRKCLRLDFEAFRQWDRHHLRNRFVNVATHPIRPAIYFYDTEGVPDCRRARWWRSASREVAEDRKPERIGRRWSAGGHHDFPKGSWSSGSVKVVSDGPLGGLVRYGPKIGVAGWEPARPVRDALFPPPPGGRNPHGGGAAQPVFAEAMGVSCRLMSAGVALEEVEIPLEANGQTSWFIEEAFTRADTSDFLAVGALHRARQGTVLAVDDGCRRASSFRCRRWTGREAGAGRRYWILRISPTGRITDLVLESETQPSRPAPRFHTDIPSRPEIYFYDTEGNPIAADRWPRTSTGDLEIPRTAL